MVALNFHLNNSPTNSGRRIKKGIQTLTKSSSKRSKKEKTLKQISKFLSLFNFTKIYRLLAFEFKATSSGLKMSIISNMVANLFYPLEEAAYTYIDEEDESKAEKNSKTRFVTLINEAFGQYCMKDEISEEQFCKAMESIEKYMTDETTSRFLEKIFRRHDKDRVHIKNLLILIFLFKDGFLNREEFTQLLKNYNNNNLTEKEIDNIFESMLTGGAKQIDLDAFKRHSM